MDGAQIATLITAVGALIGAAGVVYKTRTEHEGSTVDSQVRIMAELNEKLNEDNARLRSEVKDLRDEVKTLRDQVEDMPTLRALVAQQANTMAQLRRELDTLKGLS